MKLGSVNTRTPTDAGPETPGGTLSQGALDRDAMSVRWVVPVLTLATFVTMLHAMALGPILPDIARDLDTSVALLGQIPALMMLLAAVVGLLAGPLADRFGHHRALVGSLLVIVTSSLGMALAPGYLYLLIAALVGSIGRAIVQPVAVVIAGNRFEGDSQRRAISWVMAGVTGAVIAGVPALTTVAGVFGWRIALVGLAAITAVLIPLVQRGLGAADARDQTRSSFARIVAAYHPLIRHRPTVGLIVTTLLGSAGVWVMATYLGAFYAEQHGYTTQQIGWVYFVPGITLFIGSLSVGGRVGELPLRPFVMVTRIVTGIAIAGVLILPIPALAGIGLLALQGMTTGASGVAVVFLLMRESPAGRATTMTLNTAALSLGTALGSALGGLVLSVASFPLVGVCAAVLSCSSAYSAWFTGKSVTPQPVLPA